MTPIDSLAKANFRCCSTDKIDFKIANINRRQKMKVEYIIEKGLSTEDDRNKVKEFAKTISISGYHIIKMKITYNPDVNVKHITVAILLFKTPKESIPIDIEQNITAR